MNCRKKQLGEGADHIWRNIPDYAKTPSGSENWVQKGKEAPRTQYYKEHFQRVKTKASSARQRLQLDLNTKIHGSSQKIESIAGNEKMTLAHYLKDKVFDGDSALMLEALHNLQVQGYQVDFFPEGYTVEVSSNQLSIYKDGPDGREYYKSPDTQVSVQELKVLDGLKTKSSARPQVVQTRTASAPTLVPTPPTEEPVEPKAPSPTTPNPIHEEPAEISPPKEAVLPEAPPAAPPAAPVPAESTNSTPTTVEPSPPSPTEKLTENHRLTQGVKNNLALLIEEDSKVEATGHSISSLLDEIGTFIDELLADHPDEADLFAFQKMHEDLQSDFGNGNETDLDSSFSEINEEMRAEIARSGVEQHDMSNIPTQCQANVIALRRLNIEPSYVVSTPKPGAKTVVLFMQTHAAPVGADIDQLNLDEMPQEILDYTFPPELLGAEASQEQIYQAISQAKDRGLIQSVYDEGLPYEQEFTSITAAFDQISGVQFDQLIQTLENNPRMLQQLVDEIVSSAPADLSKKELDTLKKNPRVLLEQFKSSGFRAAIKYKNALRIIGYDFDALKHQVLEGKEELFYRMTAHNALIASNLSEMIEVSPDTTSFASIGAMHEQYPPGIDLEHPLPFSHTLAHQGMNVIVVDTAFRTDKAVK